MKDEVEISWNILILFPLKYIKLKFVVEENFWKRHFLIKRIREINEKEIFCDQRHA